ncbi:serine--tRNA ligase [Novosphingobium sp. Gsoil 351]|uniref:serine--tRNA ligase n=1 Tax=Novosphingobium sp. Gsoil 351 TaxID=2675225 RepID=UPI0012B44481|nr:serine--tRNA ligase [Novosphingobium sp. Gsoil 351]QGN54527.1 serine--tRNA ligase [Novosphingobium sp. Gsoil 351]
MHDIRLIRDDPKAFDAALARRGLGAQAAAVLALDTAKRAVATRLQEGLARRNEASKAIGAAMGQGRKEEADALKEEVGILKVSLPALEQEEREQTAALHDALAALPNRPADDVPEGDDEAGNVEQKAWGARRQFNYAPANHADLGAALGLDFETGAQISGARFTFLRGQMARLQRALGQFMLDRQTAAGFTECAPPLLVRSDAMFGTGQLPKFAEDSFRTGDDHWLIPTSEVSLTNSVREQILADGVLPIKLTALTPCFRSEAGSAGKDTRGYIRQHQFEKVELVTICRPEDSAAQHERMTLAAEAILEALELPYRRMLLCAGDMGFSARKTYDLEVWLPGQDAYREISSISNCGDFQARRMNTRYRPEGGPDGKKGGTEFVHTLNGSGLAVGRTLVAVLENYQQEDGSVHLPVVLHPYMGGVTKLTPAL